MRLFRKAGIKKIQAAVETFNDCADKFKIMQKLIFYEKALPCPPYHSKYNPVERVRGVLENDWSGNLLVNVETVFGKFLFEGFL